MTSGDCLVVLRFGVFPSAVGVLPAAVVCSTGTVLRNSRRPYLKSNFVSVVRLVTNGTIVDLGRSRGAPRRPTIRARDASTTSATCGPSANRSGTGRGRRPRAAGCSLFLGHVSPGETCSCTSVSYHLRSSIGCWLYRRPTRTHGDLKIFNPYIMFLRVRARCQSITAVQTKNHGEPIT